MVRITRKFAELSQLDLAEKSGIPQAAISAIETGRLELGPERARRLGDALGIHPGALLFPQWAPPKVKKARATKTAAAAAR
jgi:transcriptional regulator with XRE-family HTH domain